MSMPCNANTLMPKIAILLPALLLLALGLGGCSGSDASQRSEKSGAPSGGESPPTRVVFVELQPEPLLRADPLPGRVVAYQVAEIRPEVDGIIQSRRFKEGGYVEAGEQLYQIDPVRYEADYELAQAVLQEARARLRNAQRLEKRTRRLIETDAVSQQQRDDAVAALEQAEAGVSRAEAELKRARINLDDTELRSPISGFIGPSRVTRGALVTANQPEPLATVRDLDPVYVDISQAAADTRDLRKHLAAASADSSAVPFTVRLFPDKDGPAYPHTGVLEATDPAVNPQTGAIRLRSRLPNPEMQLLPGMFVRAAIEGASRQGILVPQAAVRIGAGGEKSVWIVGPEEKARQRTLRTGAMYNNNWIVESGVEPGDRLIVEGAMGLSEGAPLDPVRHAPQDD